jgi:hypothetical protein
MTEILDHPNYSGVLCVNGVIFDGEIDITKGERSVCTEFGEGISFRRQVVRDANALCRSSTGERYDEPLALISGRAT